VAHRHLLRGRSEDMEHAGAAEKKREDYKSKMTPIVGGLCMILPTNGGHLTRRFHRLER